MNKKTILFLGILGCVLVGFFLFVATAMRPAGLSSESASLKAPKPEEIGLVLPPEPGTILKEEVAQQAPRLTAPEPKGFEAPSSELKRLEKEDAVIY